MHLHGSAEIKNGHLTIGGVSTLELAKQYGTPLYVYDTALIRERARGFKETFDSLGVKAEVAYASKAFSCIAVFQLMKEEGLSLDVVSGGELYTALKAGFPPERIHFNGNNKSEEELMMAIENNIGCIVVDNFYELQLVNAISQSTERVTKVLLRVTPGIEAHTHDYILTGQEDSKFGFDLGNGQARDAMKMAMSYEGIELLGLHCHIGSQIFETTGFILAAKKIIEKVAKWKSQYDYDPRVINLGGGFGIRYTKDDDPIPPAQYVKEMIAAVKQEVERYNLEMPEIWIEPGRSLVGDAGTSLYTLGSRKEVPNIRKYLAIDGGMSDNIRPALYKAKYEAVIANKADHPPEETVSIAGKCCESGDMLIWDLPLPQSEAGDTLAVFCTGAYGYSMANNYNRIPRPAVVFVENGEARLAVQRETYEDMISLDIRFK
ncbi:MULTISPECIES: diaminopimelate decarboxylase [Rossellomorea]|jgi:diaminopimelate decarboxylase|uniref:diaminopimelate decarboxylase n=1 Tax=Rossellomorea TaxID=2837508 RepID=UPI0011E8E745|nr:MULTISPECIES: diaminopimelate decarboxylase [Rossellomorea]MDT9024726.1 diaminopimelate decarboxylase [Rossellomorea sp. YC4-1]TYS87841.1 diaminopimelate decarboxylase [Rossellomorea aquimaris]